MSGYAVGREERHQSRPPLRRAISPSSTCCRASEDKLSDAETQDISAGGVLFHCSVDYPVGSTIQFAISMPGQALGTKNDVQVECVGRVVRCTPAGDRVAVGAIIDEYFISR